MSAADIAGAQAADAQRVESQGIEVHGLSHRYPNAGTPALQDISLSIPRGCNFGLLGPNGAGKTTLLSILTGLQTPQTGSITVAGLDFAQHAADIKRISAYVPQDYAFYMNLTGRENLRFFADIYDLNHSQRLERTEYCIQVCRLHEALDKRAAHYSGGMKRRLNLAIGLMNAPQILYLDEPTVGIDTISRQVIIDAIRALRTQQVTVVYTSHYMEEVEKLCDELAIINRGRLVARDTTAQLLQQGEYKTLLLNFAQVPAAGVLQSLQAWQPVALHAKQFELSLADADDLEQIMHICTAEHLHIEQVQFGISRLERIYLSLLQNESLQGSPHS